MKLKCKVCNKEKEIIEFSPSNRNEKFWCMDCVKIYNKNYVAKNKEKLLEDRRSYYKINKEVCKEKAKKFMKKY